MTRRAGYLRKDQRPTTVIGLPKGAAMKTQDVPKPYLRKWEQVARLVRADAGLCSRDRAPISEWQFNWSDEAPFTVTTGCVNHTQVFPNYRHSDGTLCDPERPDLYYTYPLPTCRACGALDPFKTEQQAWGDLITCTVCGDSHYYSIGD